MVAVFETIFKNQRRNSGGEARNASPAIGSSGSAGSPAAGGGRGGGGRARNNESDQPDEPRKKDAVPKFGRAKEAGRLAAEAMQRVRGGLYYIATYRNIYYVHCYIFYATLLHVVLCHIATYGLPQSNCHVLVTTNQGFSWLMAQPVDRVRQSSKTRGSSRGTAHDPVHAAPCRMANIIIATISSGACSKAKVVVLLQRKVLI